RHAALADRRTQGAAIRCAWRAFFTDATIPNPASCIRTPLVHGEGCESLSARRRTELPQAVAEGIPQRRNFYATESAGHDSNAGQQWRRELGQFRSRSQQRDDVRAFEGNA